MYNHATCFYSFIRMFTLCSLSPFLSQFSNMHVDTKYYSKEFRFHIESFSKF